MTLNILFAGREDRWSAYEPALNAAFSALSLDTDLRNEFEDSGVVDYIVYAPNGPVKDFSPFTRAKAVLNLWAGVEAVVGNPTLKIPLTRMVDQGLAEGMTEWVVGHVLRHHLGMDRQILNQNGHWDAVVPPLARDRTVAVLGIGELGQACAEALAALRFNVLGWSRSQKDIAGITCLSGKDGLNNALQQADIVVLLLPKTPDTENLLNAASIASMKSGAVVINPGRGPLIDDDAMLDALDSGQISHATLDVFRVEPLPATHPYWSHPNVTVTPHIAAETRAKSSAEVIAENIRRNEVGEDMLYLVDRGAGY